MYDYSYAGYNGYSTNIWFCFSAPKYIVGHAWQEKNHYLLVILQGFSHKCWAPNNSITCVRALHPKTNWLYISYVGSKDLSFKIFLSDSNFFCRWSCTKKFQFSLTGIK